MSFILDKTNVNLKSLFNNEDTEFYDGLIKECHDGMKNYYHWNFERTLFFNMLEKNTIVAEIGVHAGKNAYRIYNVINPKKLYLIDPWTLTINDKKHTQNNDYTEQLGAELVCKKYFENKQNVEIIKNWSLEAVNLFDDDYFDLVYIDGDHSYDAVLNDLSFWSKKVKVNKYLGGHDYYNNSSNNIFNAVNTFLNNNKNYKLVYTPPKELWGKDSSDGHYDFLLQKIN